MTQSFRFTRWLAGASIASAVTLGSAVLPEGASATPPSRTIQRPSRPPTAASTRPVRAPIDRRMGQAPWHRPAGRASLELGHAGGSRVSSRIAAPSEAPTVPEHPAERRDLIRRRLLSAVKNSFKWTPNALAQLELEFTPTEDGGIQVSAQGKARDASTYHPVSLEVTDLSAAFGGELISAIRKNIDAGDAGLFVRLILLDDSAEIDNLSPLSDDARFTR